MCLAGVCTYLLYRTVRQKCVSYLLHYDWVILGHRPQLLICKCFCDSIICSEDPQCWVILAFLYLFKVIKSWENDLMTSSNQTHGSQQLQHQSFSPASAESNITHIKTFLSLLHCISWALFRSKSEFCAYPIGIQS